MSAPSAILFSVHPVSSSSPVEHDSINLGDRFLMEFGKLSSEHSDKKADWLAAIGDSESMSTPSHLAKIQVMSGDLKLESTMVQSLTQNAVGTIKKLCEIQ